MSVAVGIARSVAPGEDVAGDEAVVVRSAGRVLIGLADGLGHGPHAARAASAFCRYVEERAAAPLEEILAGAGEALAETRGAAAALLCLDEGADALEFSGVGNVALKALTRAAMPIFSAAGIVGRRVRKLRSFRFPLHAGDVLALHSDGISGGFDLAAFSDPDPHVMASRIIEAHRKSFDDATCVVVRYGGKAAG